MGYAALWWAASTASPRSSIDASKEQRGSLTPPFVESWNTRRSPDATVAGTTLSATLRPNRFYTHPRDVTEAPSGSAATRTPSHSPEQALPRQLTLPRLTILAQYQR